VIVIVDINKEIVNKLTRGNIMKHLFYRKNVNEKWHWHKECVDFPFRDIKEMSFFFNNSGDEFCEECKKLDKVEQEVRIRATGVVI
jgi:hypothetical protein